MSILIILIVNSDSKCEMRVCQILIILIVNSDSKCEMIVCQY